MVMRPGVSVYVLGRFVAAIVALIAFGTCLSFAQTSTATILGTVKDTSGALIPGVSITVKHTESGLTRTVVSGERGGYNVPLLPVGPYELTTTMPGFKQVIRSGINLVVGQEAVVDLTLEVGANAEQVTVTGEAPLVNTTTSSVAGLVNERQVKDLPLNGRSFDNLITLNAGAINYTALKTPNAPTAGEGNSFSVAGRRPLENLFLLNGIEYTGASVQSNTPGGVSGQLLGIDAVREFNLVSDTYSAQYGKRAGAQVNIVTQSGTNQLHGTAFEFLRNSALDARNFFDVQNA